MSGSHISLEILRMSRSEKLIRRGLVRLRPIIDDKYFYLLSSVLKKIRAFFRRSKSSAEELINSVERNKSFNELMVCITHDIDSYSCSVNLEKLLQITDLYKIDTTVNVLTEGPYDVSELVRQIPDNHEIGLHGDFHDIAFGFRSIPEINKRLEMCLKKLSPLTINSFRAPGLAISKELIDSLDWHGIQIDSSIPSWPLFKHDVKPILHRISSGKVFELPMALSDDLLFRELGLTDLQACALVSNLSNMVADHKGILVLNFHPGVTINKIETYRSIVQTLANRPNTKFATISSAVQFHSSK